MADKMCNEKEYLSCEYVEGAVCFLVDSVVVCCYALSIGYDAFSIVPNFKGQSVDWDSVLEIKQSIREKFAKNQIPQACKECPRLKYKDWNSKDKFDYILINHWDNCNLKCIYCYTYEKKKEFNKMKPYKILPVLKDAVKNRMLSDGCWIDITGGEPAVLKEFPDIMKFIINETNAIALVNTAGVDYSKWIRKGLEVGRVSPTISLDSGTRETYKKIKSFDYFDKVVSNIKKYQKGLDEVKNSLISLKYIFIPGVNDNMEELQKWLDLVVDLGIKNIKVEIEHQWYVKNRYIPENIKQYLEYVKDFTHNYKCNLSYRELLVHHGYRDEIHYIENGLWYNHN